METKYFKVEGENVVAKDDEFKYFLKEWRDKQSFYELVVSGYKNEDGEVTIQRTANNDDKSVYYDLRLNPLFTMVTRDDGRKVKRPPKDLATRNYNLFRDQDGALARMIEQEINDGNFEYVINPEKVNTNDNVDMILTQMDMPGSWCEYPIGVNYNIKRNGEYRSGQKTVWDEASGTTKVIKTDKAQANKVAFFLPEGKLSNTTDAYTTLNRAISQALRERAGEAFVVDDKLTEEEPETTSEQTTTEAKTVAPETTSEQKVEQKTN